MSLSGRVAIVTGASSGIGRALAAQLVSSGCKVVLTARREERLRQITGELNQSEKNAAYVAGDTAQSETISAMFQTARKVFGKDADIVVINAGRGLRGTVTTANLEEFESILRTNVIGAAKILQQAAGVFTNAAASGGFPERAWDIVVVGSTVGRHVSPFSAVYGSTKFAVHSLAEGARRELGPKGIRVTLIEPGVVLSEFQEVAGYDEALQKSFADRFSPLLVPDDVARTISFVLDQPPHVHLGDIVIRSTRQDYP